MSTGRLVSPDPSRPATFAHSNTSADWDILPAQLQIGTPFHFSYRLGHPSRSVKDRGNLPVQLQIETPFWFSYRLGHPSSLVTDWGTLPVQLQIGTPFQFSYRLGHGSFQFSYRISCTPYRLKHPYNSVTQTQACEQNVTLAQPVNTL